MRGSGKHEIIIVGGGVTGLTIAALLAHGPHADELRISLVDAAPRPVFDIAADVALRVSAVSLGSARLLASVGAWQVVERARLCPYEHMRVWDQDEEMDGPSTLHFDADEFAVPALGYIVENVLLQQAILSVLEASAVELRFATPIASIRLGNPRHTLELANGDSLQASLIVGADGARSLVRKNAGIDVSDTRYAQTALVTHLETEQPHNNTAWQRFLREGPLGMLPLADGRISVVWSTTPEKAAQAIDGNDTELGNTLTTASDAVLGQLRVAGSKGAFPLNALHAKEYVRHGIALIGDAAHAVHPLAGQGANLGLRDAHQLATVLHAALDNGEHPADRPVLRRYERARRGENANMMRFMTGLNRLFAADSSVLSELRRTGMTLFNHSGPLRERVVASALGTGTP